MAKFFSVRSDRLWIVACAIFLIGGAAFKRLVVGADFRWDLALIGLTATGMIAAFIGIVRAFRQRRLPVCSAVGIILNAALAGSVILTLIRRQQPTTRLHSEALSSKYAVLHELQTLPCRGPLHGD